VTPCTGYSFSIEQPGCQSQHVHGLRVSFDASFGINVCVDKSRLYPLKEYTVPVSLVPLAENFSRP
jgi:hypothetical protein